MSCSNCVFWTASKYDSTTGICGCPDSPITAYSKIDGLCPPESSCDYYCGEFKAKRAVDFGKWRELDDLFEADLEVEIRNMKHQIA